MILAYMISSTVLVLTAGQLELVRRRREEIAGLEAELVAKRRRVQGLLKGLTVV